MRYSPYILSDKVGSELAVENKIFIYFLLDPRTNNVRYVGKTGEPRRRYHQYMSNANTGKDEHLPVMRWVKKLRAAGHFPLLHLEELVPHKIWEEREIYWIAHYRALGYKLLNILPGGGGLSGFTVPDATKDKISNTLMGHSVSTETRDLISESLTGKTLPQEVKDKVGEASAKSWSELSPAQHQARVDKMAGSRTYDEEFGRRVSEAKRGRRPNRPGTSSQYTGVSQQAGNDSWQVYVNDQGTRRYLGSFKTEEGAASAYNREARVLGLPLNQLTEVLEPRILAQDGHVGMMKPGRSSKYPGVGWNKKKGRWVAQFTLNKKRTIVGQFEDEATAYEAYRLALAKAREA